MSRWDVDPFGDGGFGDDDTVTAPDTSTDVPPIGHVALGLSRVIQQYQLAPKLRAFLTAILQQSDDLEAAALEFDDILDPSIMTGVNLDHIGNLVGISRILQTTITLPGGITTNVLDDAEYRIVIAAKILKNASHGHDEEILDGISSLFQTNAVNIDDFGHMQITVAIGRLLTDTEIAIITQLDLLARPAGVRIVGIVNYDFDHYFGFQDQNNAKTFGELTDPTAGGAFAELL